MNWIKRLFGLKQKSPEEIARQKMLRQKAVELNAILDADDETIERINQKMQDDAYSTIKRDR